MGCIYFKRRRGTMNEANTRSFDVAVQGEFVFISFPYFITFTPMWINVPRYDCNFAENGLENSHFFDKSLCFSRGSFTDFLGQNILVVPKTRIWAAFFLMRSNEWKYEGQTTDCPSIRYMEFPRILQEFSV